MLYQRKDMLKICLFLLDVIDYSNVMKKKCKLSLTFRNLEFGD